MNNKSINKRDGAKSSSHKPQSELAQHAEPKWGSKLFLATLVVVLIFFWWLLIHSGGVAGHH